MPLPLAFRRICRAGFALVCVPALGHPGIAAASTNDVVLESMGGALAVSADTGRITRFVPVGSARSILWVNDDESRAAEAAQAGYENWGGDKLWPAPQPFWRYALGRIWPPDEAADGAGAELQSADDGEASLVFPVSEAFGTRLTRRISMDPAQPLVRIRNSVEQLHPSPFPAQLWSITQVPLPETVLLDVADAAPSDLVNLNGLRKTPPLGPVDFEPGTIREGQGWIAFTPGDKQQKLGSMGRWIAGVWAEGILVQTVGFDPAGMYPEASSLQFYSGGRYGELETLGPARHLAAGETLQNEVCWLWIPIPAGTSREPAALVAQIRAALVSAGLQGSE